MMLCKFFLFVLAFKPVYKKAESICREYAALKGPGTSARPWEHPFFKRIGPLMRTRLEKAERENGFM